MCIYIYIYTHLVHLFSGGGAFAPHKPRPPSVRPVLSVYPWVRWGLRPPPPQTPRGPPIPGYLKLVQNPIKNLRGPLLAGGEG